jgi:hypothetical protein
MAKEDFELEQSATWEMAGTSAECAARLLGVINGDGGKVNEQDDASMSGKYGSQVLMRIFGAWYTKWMPLKFEVSVAEADGVCTVQAMVTEAMGVGTMAGFRRKFEKRITLVLGNMQAA